MAKIEHPPKIPTTGWTTITIDHNVDISKHHDKDVHFVKDKDPTNEKHPWKHRNYRPHPNDPNNKFRRQLDVWPDQGSARVSNFFMWLLLWLLGLFWRKFLGATGTLTVSLQDTTLDRQSSIE
jgi:hypothetical protein